MFAQLQFKKEASFTAQASERKRCSTDRSKCHEKNGCTVQVSKVKKVYTAQAYAAQTSQQKNVYSSQVLK